VSIGKQIVTASKPSRYGLRAQTENNTNSSITPTPFLPTLHFIPSLLTHHHHITITTVLVINPSLSLTNTHALSYCSLWFTVDIIGLGILGI
jgi:hypothetical protein